MIGAHDDYVPQSGDATYDVESYELTVDYRVRCCTLLGPEASMQSPEGSRRLPAIIASNGTAGSRSSSSLLGVGRVAPTTRPTLC